MLEGTSLRMKHFATGADLVGAARVLFVWRCVESIGIPNPAGTDFVLLFLAASRGPTQAVAVRRAGDWSDRCSAARSSTRSCAGEAKNF